MIRRMVDVNIPKVVPAMVNVVVALTILCEAKAHLPHSGKHKFVLPSK